MKSFIRMVIRYYSIFFQFIAIHRLKNKDTDLTILHTLTISVLATGLLLWSYTLIAIFCMKSPMPGLIGLTCSSLYALSPTLFRMTNRHILISTFMLTMCVIQQLSFSYFSGGLENNILIWFAMLPIIAGIVSGKKASLIWGSISLMMTGILVIINSFHFTFPNHLSKDGLFYSRFIIHIGFTVIITSLTFHYTKSKAKSERLLQNQKAKIEDLFRVLFHDLANPLSRVHIGLSIIKQEEMSPRGAKAFSIINEASESMLSITQNVRKMYSISKGKEDLILTPTSLNECVDFLFQSFSNELSKKRISIDYDHHLNEDIKLLVDPISFKHQVLANIITNAIKFSKEGGVIHIEVREIKPNIFSVDITDEGVGIPKELIPHLFVDDKKTYRQGTHGETGSGFGLIIMKSFMELYGGAVNIRSNDASTHHKTGTTFTLILDGTRN